MEEAAIDTNLNYIRGCWFLSRSHTVADIVKFWVSVGPYWGKYPRREKLTPWFDGIEDTVRDLIVDSK